MDYSTKSKENDSQAEMRVFFAKQTELLKTEMDFVRRNGEKRTKIYEGKLVSRFGSKFIYSFEADSDLTYPDNTQIRLFIPGKADSIPASILSCDDLIVIIQTEISLGNYVPYIEFTSEAWRLLEYLIERIDSLRSHPSDIVKSIICDGRNQFRFEEKIRTGQDAALQMSLKQPITFIWGPPGTGKTTTLADIALRHIENGYRVLMLSYSNVSVDGAINKVWEKETRRTPGKLVRYGYPRDKQLIQHEFLTSYKLALYRHPEHLSEQAKLNEEKKKLSKSSERYVKIKKQLMRIRADLNREEKKLVEQASFVATTVSKAVADDILYGGNFDTVIFDEASMAYIPYVVFAAGLARKHFICMGDFKQLPPIVQSDNAQDLNIDIFRYCGIENAVNGKISHGWLCLLNTQRRMHPKISDFIKFRMYHGLLNSAPEMAEKTKKIVDSAPYSGEPLYVADLSGMMSVCIKTREESRVNVLSSIITVGLALRAAEDNSVGIITPYNAQSRLIYSLVKDMENKRSNLHPITCKTVHQFQGSEEDVIIYDAVDCYRMKYPGVMLISTKNGYANRLFNVALTRARGKMITVAHVSYMRNGRLPENLLFGQLMNKLVTDHKVSKGEEILFEDTRGSIKVYHEDTAEKAYLNDAASVNKSIQIDIPGGTTGEKEFYTKLSKELDRLRGKGEIVCIRTENKQSIPEEIRRFAEDDKKAMNPLSLFDGSIIWFGMPPSDADFIVDKWKVPTKYRPIIRIESEYYAHALQGFLGLKKTSAKEEGNRIKGANYQKFSSYVAGEVNCSSCGKKVKLKQYANGKFVLECTSVDCGKHEAIGDKIVEGYLDLCERRGKNCPLCNATLGHSTGKLGIYIFCNGNSKHRFELDEI